MLHKDSKSRAPMKCQRDVGCLGQEPHDARRALPECLRHVGVVVADLGEQHVAMSQQLLERTTHGVH